MHGRVLAGRYRLISKLGQGGMGSVWRSEHIELGTPAAIKLIDPSIADNQDALARFKREAQAAASLRSPHVVQILDYGVDGGTPFIAMELLDGENLADRLERQGKLSPLETATVVTHVARAVGKGHAMGIVHRDLKPDNIYLVHNEDDELVKVLDFGVAKQTSRGPKASLGPQTHTGAMLGTPYYMSPEQAGGKKTVDHRTDIWALAVIAFECITGKRPFDAETLGGLVLAICTEPEPIPSRVAPVPTGFDEWFARGTDRDIGRRYQSIQDQAAELRAICGLGTRGALANAVDVEEDTDAIDWDTDGIRLRVDGAAQQPQAGVTAYADDAGLLLSAIDDGSTAPLPVRWSKGRGRKKTPRGALSASGHQARPTSVTLRGPSGGKGKRLWSLLGGVFAALAGAVAISAYVLAYHTDKTQTDDPAAMAATAEPAPVPAPPAEPTAQPSAGARPSGGAILSVEDLPAESDEAVSQVGARTLAPPLQHAPARPVVGSLVAPPARAGVPDLDMPLPPAKPKPVASAASPSTSRPRAAPIVPAKPPPVPVGDDLDLAF